MSVYYINDTYQVDPIAISILDRGLNIGDAIFETIRVNTQGKIPELDQHLQRLYAGMAVLGIKHAITHQLVQKVCADLILKNKLIGQRAFLRILVTRGESTRGLSICPESSPTIIIRMDALPNQIKQQTLGFAEFPINEHSPLIAIKHNNYLERILARNQAQQQGYDDVLFCNTKGFITETSIANFFLLKQACLITPPLSDGVLPGTTRARIIKIATQLGVSCAEQSISVSDIDASCTAFTTNSLQLATIVSRLGDTTLATVSTIVDAIISQLKRFHAEVVTG